MGWFSSGSSSSTLFFAFIAKLLSLRQHSFSSIPPSLPVHIMTLAFLAFSHSFQTYQVSPDKSDTLLLVLVENCCVALHCLHPPLSLTLFHLSFISLLLSLSLSSLFHLSFISLSLIFLSSLSHNSGVHLLTTVVSLPTLPSPNLLPLPPPPPPLHLAALSHPPLHQDTRTRHLIKTHKEQAPAHRGR